MCLGFEACRYNGEMVDTDWLKELLFKADVVAVCPEVLVGLGVPRKPINLYKKDDRVHVIQDETGLDVTVALEVSSDEFLSTLGDVDAFILKSRSPSCGLGTTKIRWGDWPWRLTGKPCSLTRLGWSGRALMRSSNESRGAPLVHALEHGYLAAVVNDLP